MPLPKLEAPVYTLTIPSTQERFEYRPYTVKEEKSLLIAKETGTEKDLINSSVALLEKCIEGINTKELTTFDFEHIFLLLRSKSAGETSDVMVECEECNKSTLMTVNLDQAYVDGEIKTPEEMTIKITDTVGVEMSYPRFTNSITEELSEIELITTTLARCIKTIYDENGIYDARDYSDSELIDFVESLSSQQFKEFVGLFESIPSIAIDAKYRCEHCHHLGETKIEGLASFF